MPRKGANVSLSSYDDIFSTEQSRTEAGQEHVQEIPLEELHPFEGHPFKVLDNEEMQKSIVRKTTTARDLQILIYGLLPPFPISLKSRNT